MCSSGWGDGQIAAYCCADLAAQWQKPRIRILQMVGASTTRPALNLKPPTTTETEMNETYGIAPGCGNLALPLFTRTVPPRSLSFLRPALLVLCSSAALTLIWHSCLPFFFSSELLGRVGNPRVAPLSKKAVRPSFVVSTITGEGGGVRLARR